ncbi:MAG: hypothetical protein KC461_12915 [Dehalococcoidia bacterium]|nr:hypothetical protein [Dehalococcoidia bacterium]MCA9851530.1 hypothetical protein [Dehalococcoidia bacterium]MCA9855965.1 hypothetical protein [Dehalococcoidia bacterium]MCB9483437.1 hypothetical protein [Dehalococcoidia bacterium]MCB9491558.1 hypothetical protein [Dehalococcoidia bacterium]
MLRRLRTVVLVVVAAALGAALGRVALQARQRIDAGESPSDIDFGQIGVRFQDVIPGLVAAFRVKDAPWSWFHIPSWLAAFAVNFGVGAAGGDIASLRARAERMAFDAVGLDAREFGMGGEWDDETETPTDATGSTTHASWASTPPPPPPPAGDD